MNNIYNQASLFAQMVGKLDSEKNKPGQLDFGHISDFALEADETKKLGKTLEVFAQAFRSLSHVTSWFLQPDCIFERFVGQLSDIQDKLKNGEYFTEKAMWQDVEKAVPSLDGQ